MLNEDLLHLLMTNRAEVEKINRKAIKIDPFKKEKLDLLQSKIGGSPYLPSHMDFPTGTNGHLLFLGQINFAELPPNDMFPKKGILQFFVNDDALFGKGIKGVSSSENYSVRFFSDPSENQQLVEDFSFLRKYKHSPIDSTNSYSLHFKNDVDIIPPNDSSLYTHLPLLAEALKEQQLNAWDPFIKLKHTRGHKLLGYGHFPIRDPRRNPDDILLFQLDSDTSIGSLWGDMGTAYFFISIENLLDKKFEAAYFTWDCFKELLE